MVMHHMSKGVVIDSEVELRLAQLLINRADSLMQRCAIMRWELKGCRELSVNMIIFWRRCATCSSLAIASGNPTTRISFGFFIRTSISLAYLLLGGTCSYFMWKLVRTRTNF